MGFLNAVRMLVLGTLLAATSAEAAQVLTLNYRDQEFRGYNTLHLKQDLRSSYPYLRLDNMELIAVRLVAKSRQNQGQATLIVGQNQSFSYNVPGRMYEFDSRDPRSFAMIDMSSPNRRSEGVWQIALQGNIRVNQVQVMIEEERRGPYRPGDGRPPYGPGRPGDGPGRPGNGPGRPGDGFPPRPRNDNDRARDIIGAIGGIIIDEIGRR